MIEAALVSCDDHLDLNMLPADVWTGRMAQSWGDRVPRVVEQDKGPALWMADGAKLLGVNGHSGRTSVAGRTEFQRTDAWRGSVSPRTTCTSSRCETSLPASSPRH